MVWWEENRMEYVFRLATNERLVAKIARELRRARSSSFGCDVPRRGP